jgi:hypothetical protein
MDRHNKKNQKIKKSESKTTIAPKDNKAKEDKELDKKLKDTFPASDSTAEY